METRDKGSGIRCNEHPDAPHSFMRDASHSAGRDEWKEWLRESWDEAQARTHTIKTWRDRCEEHPDHEGIVTERMIRNRMQEEIDELRQAIAEEEKREWVGLTDEERIALWGMRSDGPSNSEIRGFARAIEAKLKEKNT